MAALVWEREYYYYPGNLAVRIVNVVIGLIQAAFAARILLRLMGANPGSQFVAWVYNFTDSMLGPFAGALPDLSFGPFAAIELSVLLAMVGYSIFGWLIIRLIHFIFLSSRRLYEDDLEHRPMPLRGL